MFRITVLLTVLWICVAEGQLTLNGVNCGQKVCKKGDYCSDFDRTCRPCSEICNNSTHNYDANLCMKACQDYLHEILYVRKDDNDTDSSANLKATVQRLSHMITVILTLVCFMLAALAAVLIIQVYRWKKKKNITLTTIKNKIFNKSESNSNKNGQKPNEKPDFRLDIPTSPSTQSDHSPVTVTTSISRRPAEDSTLDYAYDNPAMTTSPSPTNNQSSHRY